MATLTVPSRFNGPPASGNGGYSCGMLAAHFAGPVAVNLRRPVPLDEPLEVGVAEDGTVRATAAGELIAEAVAAPHLAPWSGPRVDLAAARAARGRYPAPADGNFGRCFVCGRAREDGFDVFTGPVAPADLPRRSHFSPHGGDNCELTEGRSQFSPDGEDFCELTEGLVATDWVAPDWAADEDGVVLPEFVWAALDCPAYFALHADDLDLAFLVRQQSEILAPVRAGVEYVVAGRPLARSGRKGLATTAILDADGEVLAHAECLFVEPRAAP